MAGEGPSRRGTRIFISYECKRVGGAGSSFAEPLIARQLATHLAAIERSRGGVMLTSAEIVKVRNLIVHGPGLVAAGGDRRAPASPERGRDFDIDVVVEIPHHAADAPAPQVPSAAETILSYVCAPEHLERLLGDLEQNFRRRAAKHGSRAACRYYWFQVARAVVAAGWDVLQRLDLLRGLLDRLRF